MAAPLLPMNSSLSPPWIARADATPLWRRGAAWPAYFGGVRPGCFYREAGGEVRAAMGVWASRSVVIGLTSDMAFNSSTRSELRGLLSMYPGLILFHYLWFRWSMSGDTS